MENSISEKQNKIKKQMIAVAVLLLIVILLGTTSIIIGKDTTGVIKTIPVSKSTSLTKSSSLEPNYITSKNYGIDISNLGGGASNASNTNDTSFTGKMHRNKIFIVLIVLLVALLVMLFINSSKNNNRQLTEDDINHYNETVKEARQIAGLSDNSQAPSENSLNDKKSNSLSGRPNLSGMSKNTQNMHHNNNINSDIFPYLEYDKEPALDDFFQVQY